MDSERANMTSRLCSIVNSYLGCMVSEKTIFYCKTDMTSSWFLRQGALHVILQDGFWKSDHEFLIAFNSNFYLWCMVCDITRFSCQADMTSSSILRQGALNAHFHDLFWKSDHDFVRTFHSNFSSGMRCFRDNDVLLQAGYDVIVIILAGALDAILHSEFWQSDHDLLIGSI